MVGFTLSNTDLTSLSKVNLVSTCGSNFVGNGRKDLAYWSNMGDKIGVNYVMAERARNSFRKLENQIVLIEWKSWFKNQRKVQASKFQVRNRLDFNYFYKVKKSKIFNLFYFDCNNDVKIEES